MPPEFSTGLVALSGVLVGYLSHFLAAHIDRKERKQRLLREKYEELCESILDSTREVQDMIEMPRIAGQSVPPASPQKAHYLALIYFPELREVTVDYSNACAYYHIYLLHAQRSHPQAAMAPEYHEEAEKVMVAKAKVDEAVSIFASKYTRA